MPTDKCPQCGSRRLGHGVFDGYARLTSKRSRGWRGSNVTALVCSDCGLIIELRAEHPERFAPKES